MTQTESFIIAMGQASTLLRQKNAKSSIFFVVFSFCKKKLRINNKLLKHRISNKKNSKQMS
jgi:hypothetical protein